MTAWVDVVLTKDFEPGDVKIVEVDNVMVAVFNMEGQYIAIEDVCPHDGSEIASGCIKNGVLECPHHGATFDLISGKVLSPPAYEPLEMIALRVRNDMIQVRDSRWD